MILHLWRIFKEIELSSDEISCKEIKSLVAIALDDLDSSKTLCKNGNYLADSRRSIHRKSAKSILWLKPS